MKSTSPTFSITFNNPPVHPNITTTLKKYPPAPKKQPTPTFSITLNNPPVRPLQPSVTVTLKKQTLPLFSRTALNTWFLSLWSAPPDPRHLANMEITTIHGSDLFMWGLPAGILLRDRIKKLRGLFLQELYTATTSDAASAAAINFRKEIDLWNTGYRELHDEVPWIQEISEETQPFVGETEDQKPYLQGCPAEVLRQPKPGDAT